MNKTTPMLFVGAVAAAIAFAPLASANPPYCANPDGSPCAVGPEGASGEIPGGPGGAAGPEGASGAIPGGPSGQAGPDGAAGCVPGVGCLNVPAG